MPPLLNPHNDLLTRTIRNIEQARGVVRRCATVADIFDAHISNQADLVSLPPTSAMMDNHTPDPDSPIDAPLSQGEAAPIDLAADLTASTALLANLRMRNSILATDLERETQFLVTCAQQATTNLSAEVRRGTKWRLTALSSLLVWMTYLWWCWYMRVEFEYIRQRRKDVFGV